MNKEKQIEEMARNLAENVAWDEDDIPTVDCLETAKRLYLNGYRKASDIFAEIEEIIDPYGDEYGTMLTIDENSFAELKKRYESEGKRD